MPDSLKLGHVENRSQNEVVPDPDTVPKLVETKVRSPCESDAPAMALASGADSDAMADGEATATNDVPEKRDLGLD